MIPEVPCSATDTWPASCPGEKDVHGKVFLASTLTSAITKVGSAKQRAANSAQLNCTVIPAVRHFPSPCWTPSRPQTDLSSHILGKCTWTVEISKRERQVKRRRFFAIFIKAVKCGFLFWLQVFCGVTTWKLRGLEGLSFNTLVDWILLTSRGMINLFCYSNTAVLPSLL